MTVYLLVAICVMNATPSKGPQIDVQTLVFKDAAKCLRNAEYNKKMLSKTYDQVSISCQEKKLLK